MKRVAIAVAMLLVTSQAQAVHLVSKVKLVESTYVPAAVAFMLSEGTASCPAGRMLFWERAAENNKAVYAMLLAAKISGGKVQIVFNEGDSNCVPQYLHLVD